MVSQIVGVVAAVVVGWVWKSLRGPDYNFHYTRKGAGMEARSGNQRSQSSGYGNLKRSKLDDSNVKSIEIRSRRLFVSAARDLWAAN